MNTLEKKEEDFCLENACKLCAPLGACMVYHGVQNAIPVIHGSQGCATYARRYLISHFREPMDIASSSFGEMTTIHGGGENLKKCLENVATLYAPELIGIASSCLAETIGEDVAMILKSYQEENKGRKIPELVFSPTPSYKGAHLEGFHAAVSALVKTLCRPCPGNGRINLFPGMLSCADLRHLKEILQDFEIPFTMLPDYGNTFDGEVWEEYEKIPPGGTPVEEIKEMSGAKASIEFKHPFLAGSAAGILNKQSGIPAYYLPVPLGLKANDELMKCLSMFSGRGIPKKIQEERGRLLDSYVDGHKILFGKKALVYGDESFVASVALFLAETGVMPILCATGGKKEALEELILPHLKESFQSNLIISGDMDYSEIGEMAEQEKPDFMVGNSKGYKISKELNIPLIRLGFPIHDRIGGQRLLSVGYRGTLRLYDEIANTLLGYGQTASKVGYGYY